jgi:serine/threonine protein kinase
VRNCKTGPLLVLQCLLAAARGLRSMHKEGFIHADMKPSNILCNRTAEKEVVQWSFKVRIPLAGGWLSLWRVWTC